MDTVLLSLRIHMVTVEPGSPADGKTLGELDLKARFGITDFGVRRGNSTTTQPDLSTRLTGGEAILVFTNDQTADELGRLFRRSA